MNSPQEVIENFIIWFTTDEAERTRLISTIDNANHSLVEMNEGDSKSDYIRVAKNTVNVIAWLNCNYPVGKEYFQILRSIADYFEEDHVDGLESINIPSEDEINDFKKEWGQTHNEICTELGYDPEDEGSGEMIMNEGDYFWHEEDQMWYNKQSSIMSEKEETISEWIRANECS